MMQRIEVDEVAQAAWAAEVRRFYTDAGLGVVDLAGQRHRLVTVSREGVLCQPFDGQASHYWLFGSGSTTRWPCSNQPSDRLHLRVDGRGQLEVWSGSLPLAKYFDSKALPAEWCPGLIHVDASKVRNLEVLLNGDRVQTLRSLDLGGAKALDDLGLVGRLKGLRSLNLNNCEQLIDITPLSTLTELVTLELGGCFKVRDLGPLNDIKALTSLGLSVNNATLNAGLEWISGLAHLTSLELCFDGVVGSLDLAPLSAIERVQELTLTHFFHDLVQDWRPFAGLKELRSLTLNSNGYAGDTASGHGLQDLRPLAALTELRTLKMKNWRDLEDIGLLAGLTRLESLDLSDCEAITGLESLAGLTRLESLDLSGCEAITDLEPLAGLTRLASLNLRRCKAITDLEALGCLSRLRLLSLDVCLKLQELSPLAGLKQLSYLGLDSCQALSELHPLASLTQLAELNLSGTNVRDIRPLASLTGLRSLDMSSCDRVSDIRPLSGLKNLVSLKMGGCERLALVAPLAELPLLTTLNLLYCANIRDADALSGAQSLRKFDYEESATRDSVLLACAVRRSDSDLVERATTAAASFELSKSPGQHARGLVAAVEVLIHRPALDDQVLRDIAAAFKARSDVPSRTWQALLSAIVRAADPTLRPAFEVALSDLPLAESERVLTPALLALANAPASAKVWALDLAQRALSAVVTSTTHAREVAPAAAVFFHAQGLPVEVDAWLERGSVAQVPAWRDRVLVALLGRALRSGEILEARRLLALLQTPERRDEARGLLVQHLSNRAEFSDAAAELDALVDRAVRASVAANALRQAPTWAGEPEAGLSLLLALDGEPDMLAEVLSSMIQQAPDSELVRHLAAVFAPKQGVNLAECLDALLAHSAVAERVKPKQLAALRGRISADATLAHQALVYGTTALLEAEGLVDKDERAEITAAILGLPA